MPEMIASLEQMRYLLYKKFSMPTVHGPVAAIAVRAEWGQKVQALYTLMLRTIITEIWILCVLLIMSIATRRRNVTHNMGVANVAIWNSQSSPASVAWSMLDYRMHIPWYAIMWALLAVLAISGQILLPFFISPRLIVDRAAPVNPDVVFVPMPSQNRDNISTALMKNMLRTPASFRAIDTFEAVDPLTGDLGSTTMKAVRFDSDRITMFNGSLPFTRLNYSYEVTGLEFGLQYVPDLMFSTQGSCYTEYNWFQGISNLQDVYSVPCTPSGSICPTGNMTVGVSSADSKPPSFQVVQTGRANRTNSNVTFALVISSVDRLSPTASNDPWYSTEPIENGFRVSHGRPAVSCWQQDTWSFRGQNKSTVTLDELHALSDGLLNITRAFLSSPQIVTLCLNLGVSALRSSTNGPLGSYINAETSLMTLDMHRLVSAAYVATKNTFAETTLSNHAQYPDILNAMVNPQTKRPWVGTGDFVVYGAGFAALSMSFLISIPIILILLFIAVYILGTNRWAHWPWGNLNAMNATILYTAIDSKNFKDDKEFSWKRSSSSPYHPVDGQALVRPSYHRRDRSYGWSSVGSQDMYLLEESRYEPTST